MVFLEERIHFTGLHQLNETHLNRLIFNPCQETGKVFIIQIFHQYRIDFDFLIAAFEGAINPPHNVIKFIDTGNALEHSSIKAIHTDVNGGYAGLFPIGDILKQTKTVCSQCDLFDTVNATNAIDNWQEVFT